MYDPRAATLLRSRASRSVVTWALAAVCVLVGFEVARADEPHLEFIRGLRTRGYHDVALEYIADLSQRTDVAPEIMAVLPFERAATLLDGAKSVANAKGRREQLDAAQAAFELFVQGAGEHPLVGEANSQRATIFKERALVELWEADDPANAQNRKAYQDRARELLLKAREFSQQAQSKHEVAFRAFPTSIPEEDTRQRAERDKAEFKYLQTILELAESTYWEAQTWDPGTPERNQLLEQAIAAFDDIFVRFRSQVVGLLARLWQGKCFEEMGMLGQAIGVYNEFLKHDGTSESMLDLKARAQWFRLICLNHESRKDSLVVIQEATDWKNAAGRRAMTEAGLGIQFEMARAQEALGSDRNLSDGDRKNWLSQAMATARQVARFPGRFKAPALGTIRRLTAALGRAEQDPRNFNDAYGAGARFAEEAGNHVREYEQMLVEGRTQDAHAAQPTLAASAAEMTRMFELALKLVDEDTDPQNLAVARLQLANGYFMQRRFYEAAVAAEYATVHLADNAEIARLAAYTRMAAYQNAYNDLAGQDRDFERQQLTVAAEDLVTRWPDSNEATDARDAIAKMFYAEGDTAKAAEWWTRVPPAAEEYPAAQIKAGQAYWSAYGMQVSKPVDEREPADTLQQWRTAAEQHLVTGINAWQSQLPQEASTPGDLALGKLSLAQIRNLNGVYATAGDVPGSVEILTQPPHSVLAAVAVPPGEKRPADKNSPQSARIASIAYQQLLRAHIGLRNLDAASDARAQLESVADEDDSESLTQVYLVFGQELQKEMEQLHASGQNDRLNDVRAGFEEFLDSMSQREQGQTFGSLLWIAETYTSLAEGSADDPAKESEFFSKASATYDRMVAKISEPAFLDDPAKQTVIFLRLADCRKRQGSYGAAEKAMLDAIKQSPQAPNVQFEAALLFRDWGASQSSESDRLLTAINGDSTRTVWGWNQLARKLQQALLIGQRDPRVEQMHYDTRYHQADCYRLYALQQPADKQIENLKLAKFGIEAFARVDRSIPPADFERFNRLYAQIREDLGEPAVPLATAVASFATARGSAEPAVAPAQVAPTATAAVPPPAPAKPMSFGFVVLLIVVVCAASIGVYVWSVQNERRKKRLKRAGRSATKMK